MPLERAISIGNLNKDWPTGTDSATRGDDHLRLIKGVLKAQFPGAEKGHGFDRPLTVSEDFLNSLESAIAASNHKIDTLFDVGSIVLRIDDRNPAGLYGGTWQLLSGDSLLTFGNGAAQSGNPTGENNPLVPLDNHSHGAHHNLSVRSAGKHGHGLTLEGRSGEDNSAHACWCYDAINQGRTATLVSSWDSGHTHALSGGFTVNDNGTSGARMNVQGATIAINVWRRTA